MLSIRTARPLQAVVLALKLADRDLRKRINDATRETLNPVWRRAVDERMQDRVDQRVFGTGTRIAAGNPPAAVAGSSRRRLPGGLVPLENWRAWEFGAVGRDTSFTEYPRAAYTRHQGGQAVQVRAGRVRRRTLAQVPSRASSGRVLYPAFAELAPRVAALWAQIVVQQYAQALEASGEE
jgi:hypothetical protein